LSKKLTKAENFSAAPTIQIAISQPGS
jgi:hypothetical protein